MSGELTEFSGMWIAVVAEEKKIVPKIRGQWKILQEWKP